MTMIELNAIEAVRLLDLLNSLIKIFESAASENEIQSSYFYPTTLRGCLATRHAVTGTNLVSETCSLQNTRRQRGSETNSTYVR